MLHFPQFHNSHPYPFLDEESGTFFARLHEDNSKILEKKRGFENALRKALEPYSKNVASLLGRLSEKYAVHLDIPDLSINRIPVEISLGYRDYQDQSIPLERWGAGTHNRTLILRKIIAAKEASTQKDVSARIMPILLIEEPESFLHPPAQAEFGNVLQDLADEFRVQVIVTSHSPYMLSHRYPEANILLERITTHTRRRDRELEKIRETSVVSTQGEDWKKPFELALGTCGPEFEFLKEAIFANSSEIILVEGKKDKEYLELLMKEEHGNNRLKLHGTVVPYDGVGNIENGALVRFISDRFRILLVTCDLDAEDKVRKTLEKISSFDMHRFISIGLNEPGKRTVEGMLPVNVINAVHQQRPELVRGLISDKREEKEDCNNRLKSLYLEEFIATAKPGTDDFQDFYKLTAKLNAALGR